LQREKNIFQIIQANIFKGTKVLPLDNKDRIKTRIISIAEVIISSYLDFQ